MPVHEASAGLFSTGCPGYTNCVSVFALTGQLLLCTDPAGCANCVSVFAPNGREGFH